MNIQTLTKEEIEDSVQRLKASQSPVTLQVVRETVEEELKDFPNPPSKLKLSQYSYDPKAIMCDVLIRDNTAYDWLMNHTQTYINSDITCSFSRRMYLASYGETVVIIDFILYCDLPPEDFETLDLLGKVHREVQAARVTTSVFCEV